MRLKRPARCQWRTNAPPSWGVSLPCDNPRHRPRGIAKTRRPAAPTQARATLVAVSSAGTVTTAATWAHPLTSVTGRSGAGPLVWFAAASLWGNVVMECTSTAARPTRLYS